MQILKQLMLALTTVYVVSCQKSEDITPDPPPPPPTDTTTTPGTPTKVDSTFLLVGIKGMFYRGSEAVFEYDNANNLVKFYRPYTWGVTSPSYVKYKEGKPSHIVSEGKLSASSPLKKSSVIFIYGSNGKCIKVKYKHGGADLDNNDPFFSNPNDVYVSPNYDSLAYSATGQLTRLYHYYGTGNNEEIKFIYANNSDTSLTKLEIYEYRSGVLTALDQLTLTPDKINSPVSKLLWYFPYVWVTTSSTTSGMPMSIPLLFDNQWTSLDGYLTYMTKMISKYKVIDTDGVTTSTEINGTYLNTYTVDSLTLKVTAPGNFFDYVEYKFKKVKK